MTKRNLEAKAWAGHDSVMLRGGRLVKRKGQVLSFAPHVGQLSSVSCGALATSFVLGAALFGATPAIAGTCDPLTPTPNPDGSAVTCSAPADEAIDETQVIVGQQLTVTTAPGFGISTSAGDGLNFNVASGYNSGLTFVDTNESQITAAETALSGNAVGTTTITSNGALDGGTYGIKFAVASVGSLTIDSTGSVNGETEDGINASISGEARNITVRAATVAGGDDGINVVNNAYGNTLIESSLSVIAAPGGGVGVVAVNRGRLSENLTVNVADVTGNAGGIEVSNLGTGATVVTSSVRVFTENGDGISANNDGFYNPITQSFDIFTTDMTVTTNIVEAANNGIIAINSGNGSTSISSSSYVSGNSGDGIGVTNGPNAQNLTIHAAAVDGGDDGIVAVNEGSGVTLVSTTGYIVGGDIGISVGNGINSGNVTVNAFENTVTGGKDGIVVSNNGSGNLSITSTGDVIGTTGTGINASAGSDVADVIIHANDVTGDDSGIVVKNDGKGATLVNATGLVQGSTDYGIAVIHGSDTTNLTVVANNVTGGTGGIFADNEGTGFASVTVSGDVTGRGDLTVVGGVAAGGDGINIYSDASTTGLTVIAGVGSNVTGINGDGIEVRNLGAGQTTVTSYGEVTGGATRNGIYAVSHGLATGLTVTAVDVTAGLSGIVAAHSGTGDVTVTATGNVQGGTSFGIYGIARHTATNLTISAHDVTGGAEGIFASNAGHGSTSVTSDGVVTGGYSGVVVINTTSYYYPLSIPTNLTVSVAEVSGGSNGIFTSNYGSGTTSITASGLVTGLGGDGIYAFNGQSASDLTIDIVSADGGDGSGVNAKNAGAGGNTSVTSTGTVTGTVDGIYADNRVGTTNLTIDANVVTGGDDGIDAKNDGDGFTLITADGDVEGKGIRDGIGISAVNGEAASSLEIIANNANTVRGGSIGIFAQNLGNGATSVSSTGDVIGGIFDGITALNSGTTLTLDVNKVTGGLNGIYAKNEGNGATLITASGLVTGNGDDGIDALNAVDALELTIVANAVKGARNGIDAQNEGSGNTTITANGLVTGTGGDGILVSTYGVGSTSITANALVTGGDDGINVFIDDVSGALEIIATDVYAGDRAIEVFNDGLGATLVSASGDVNALRGDGINVFSSGTTVTVNANNVGGGFNGIYTRNNGNGATLIAASGLVTGNGADGIYAVNATSASNLVIDIVDATGVVGNGINAVNNGVDGYTSVTSTGTVTGALDGILAANAVGTTDLTIVANVVTGGDDGIDARNNGNGFTTITATGDVTGEGADGIYALNANFATDLTIVAEGDVYGLARGISAANNGSGVLSITATGDVDGKNEDGIRAVTGLNTTGVTQGANVIVDAANVTGGTNGIFVRNTGGAATSISASGTVEGTTGVGIDVANGPAATDLTVTANAVTGGLAGISASNDGTGSTSVTAFGLVTGGASDNGIDVFNDASAGALTVDAATVTGGLNGIFVDNDGSGATVISASAAVTGSTADGIHAEASGTSLTIELSGAVTGGVNGVYSNNSGVGSTSITATGEVTGTIGDGISGRNGADATGLTIVANNVSGGDNGIDVFNGGLGVTSVTSTGAVTAVDNGIDVTNAASATDLSVVANNVTAGSIGIEAFNIGTGFTSITATGEVTGGDQGISVFNAADTTDLTVVANDVTGGFAAISTANFGTGFTSVTSSGTVTGTAVGTNSYGIYAYNGADATDLTISANTVIGDDGISVFNDGTGATSITATGKVTGTIFNGVFANSTGTDLTVNVINVAGGDNGIAVSNGGIGATAISSTGTVTGTDGNGVEAVNATTATNLTVSVNTVTGGLNGISTTNEGTGATTITASGDVTGEDADGVYALNANFTTNLTIIAEGDVSGLESGISASNNGSGVLSITARGDVDGANEDGIRAITGLNTTGVIAGANVIVDANNVTGGSNGIFVSNTGGAATSIIASGTVEGTNGTGINVANGQETTDLTVTAGVVTGGNTGIDAHNDGTGFTLITANGLVTGGDNGIDVFNDASASALTVNASAVTGGLNGILAINNGSGATAIAASGVVVGGTADGIHAEASGTNLTVAPSGDVTGGLNGIYANNRGTGSTSITATGDVTGATGDGISSRNGADATSLIIVANNVSGGDNGIDALNTGQGTTSVIANGIVTGFDNGIDVTNFANATDLIVIANTVTGGGNGIESFNLGTGLTSIKSTGSVTGGEKGISAFNAATASSLTVITADVAGGTGGISAVNFGQGHTSVTSTGTVVGANYGIYSYNGEGATDITVSAIDVKAGVDGIYVTNNGRGDTVISSTGTSEGTSGVGILARNLNSDGGALTVTAFSARGLLGGIVVQNDGAGTSSVSVTGTIAGGDGVGIDTFTWDGNLTTINVASTAIVGATSGKAIANNAGDSTLNVAADAIINGSVSLGDGNDTANFVRKGALASVTLLDGGDEVSSVDGFVDTLNLNGADDFNLVGANTVNWENININGGTVAFSDAAILAEIINVNNGATFNASNNLVATANVNVASSSALVVGNAGGTGATRITGNLANSGRIDLRSLTGGSFVGDRLNLSGNFVGSSGGQLVLDTVLNGDGSPSDLLVVGGNASGTNTIVINNVGGAGAFTQSDGIKVVQIGGVSDAAAFTLLGGGVRAGAFRYELFLGGVVDPNDQDWYLRSRIRDLTAPSISLARNSNEIAMTFLGTLHERVGEQEHVSQRGYDEGSAKGLWGRMLGKGFRDKISSANIGDISSTGKFGGMQMGLDVYRGVSDNGSRTFAGAYAGYATGSSNERSQFGGVSRIAGQTDSEGLLAGLYATHYNASGWYANAAVQGSWLDNKASAVDGTNLEANGRTWLASLELGNAFKLGKRGALEPQVQLIYGNTRLDDAVDNTGLVNEFNQSDTLTARGGFRLKTTKPENYNTEGGLFTGYLKANVWSTITGGDIGLNVAGTLIDGFKPKRAWVDAGVGATLTVARNTEIFFDADVEFGIDKQTTAGTGTVGLRFNW